MLYFFFFNDTATTEIYTLSLHDALPILLIYALLLPGLYLTWRGSLIAGYWLLTVAVLSAVVTLAHFVGAQREAPIRDIYAVRSEEHTSELQSRQYLVCRLLLEKKKTTQQ